MSKPKIKCICDKCSKEIVVKQTKKKLYTDGEKGKVYVHYFVCPHCLEKYPFHAESDEINKLTKRQQVLRKKIPKTIEVEEIDELHQEMDDNARQIKALQNEYKLLFKLDNDG
ncbi:hypothetical protein B4102_3598 [Heyndrickxia sporothermodurans]|uniref:Uncharacterized protein n=1 Tax=Heyndrickxia sporothermodurans TaxID=46224 RepID=A0A150KLG6_9BACI|nr:hypothetical protein [Heyndrickxia sporothermodurans]KYC94377.1 hypothetical protein B4102_3598 [Heyndrickxia sporothermodurans]